jgi:hypothetical protein
MTCAVPPTRLNIPRLLNSSHPLLNTTMQKSVGQEVETFFA